MDMYTSTNSPFPSQVVSDAEKASIEYGKQVAQAIEQEWFNQGRTSGNRLSLIHILTLPTIYSV